MTEVQQPLRVEEIAAVDLAAEFAKVPVLAGVSRGDLATLGSVNLIHAGTGIDIFPAARPPRVFWVLLEGQVRVHKREADGSLMPMDDISAGETFGEVPLLIGVEPQALITTLAPSTAAYFQEDVFWKLMACCPGVRAAVLANISRRLHLYITQALHREKLISLGTLAAGLMHELNNPGAAARRAASQLRENLSRLQLTSLRICSGERKTPSQMECLRNLQKQALAFEKAEVKGTLEQSDAEEQLAEWLEQQGIENAWKMAPTLSAIGLDAEGLSCAHREFPGPTLSDPLNWVEALISSVQLVGAIEESLSRVTDLVRAVKKYGYEDKAERHEVDVQDGIQNTLVILGHKFREKELNVVKQFASGFPAISTCGRGLNQVWTNLLDNAVDAAPQKGTVTVRTWVEGSHICVGIADNGPGIPEEAKSRIFEPFYTTKAMGEGTGLGLDIVKRIAIGQFGGQIKVDSEPGRTEFIVTLPIRS